MRDYRYHDGHYEGNRSPAWLRVVMTATPPAARPGRTEADARVAALYREGLPYRDIAARLGVPLSTVSYAVHRLQVAGVLPRRLRDYRFA